MPPGSYRVLSAWGPRSRSARWLASISLGAWLGAMPARAEPRAPLEWKSPPACPDVAAVSHSLGELLDIETARWDRFRSVRGQVAPLVAGGFELVLVFEAASGTRERRFRVKDCADSADLAAAALALALDPRSGGLDAAPAESGTTADGNAVAGAAPAPEPGPGTEAALPNSPLESGEQARSTHVDDSAAGRSPAIPESAAPTHLDVGAAGVLDPSALGEVSFGASVWGMARRERYSLGLHADWLPGASLDVGSRQVQLGLAAAGLRACYALSPALGICPEIEAGLLHASGGELDNGRSVQDPWLAAGLSLGVRAAALDALSVVSRVALLAPLVRSQYLVNGGELLHRTPPLVLRLSLGFELPVQ